MQFPELPLPFWAVGPRHWLFRTVYDDEDFYFHANDGTLLAAAGSTAIHGKKLFGMIPLSAGADVLLSVPVAQPDGQTKFFTAVGFEQRSGEPSISGVQKRLSLSDANGEFAGELAWNGSSGIFYDAGGVKVGSVSLPNPLRRRYRIHGAGGEKICEVREVKDEDIPAAIGAEIVARDFEDETTGKHAVLVLAEDPKLVAQEAESGGSSSLDVRLLAALMLVIPLLND